MTSNEQLRALATRAICTRNSGGYCECIGHEAHGCMVGYGEPPVVANCKMTDAALPLTAEYAMAGAALDAIASRLATPNVSGLSHTGVDRG